MESSRERAAESAEVDAWLESLEGVTRERGPAAAARLLSRLIEHGQTLGVTVPGPLNTPYVNTIPVDRQPPYPGDRDIERWQLHQNHAGVAELGSRPKRAARGCRDVAALLGHEG